MIMDMKIEIEKFTKTIEDYLSERLGDGYSWHELSGDENRELDAIIYKLITLKFRKDCDMDLGVGFLTYDRSKERLIHYHPVINHMVDLSVDSFDEIDSEIFRLTGMLSSISDQINMLAKIKHFIKEDGNIDP